MHYTDRRWKNKEDYYKPWAWRRKITTTQTDNRNKELRKEHEERKKNGNQGKYENKENKDKRREEEEGTEVNKNSVHITDYEIYKNGEDNMDPYKCIMRTGCPRTVAGKIWMDAFIESKENSARIRTRKEREKFKLIHQTYMFRTEL